jgi:hypothetical protein
LEGRALSLLADIHLHAGQPTRAGWPASEALSVQRRTGDRLGVATTLYVLGVALRASVGVTAALPHWREAHDLFARSGAPEAAKLHTLLNP